MTLTHLHYNRDRNSVKTTRANSGKWYLDSRSAE
jgi:hypothetical protein